MYGRNEPRNSTSHICIVWIIFLVIYAFIPVHVILQQWLELAGSGTQAAWTGALGHCFHTEVMVAGTDRQNEDLGEEVDGLADGVGTEAEGYPVCQRQDLSIWR